MGHAWHFDFFRERAIVCIHIPIRPVADIESTYCLVFCFWRSPFKHQHIDGLVQGSVISRRYRSHSLSHRYFLGYHKCCSTCAADYIMVGRAFVVARKVFHHGPLTRCAKLRVAHARGMPGTFPPPRRVKRSRHASRHVRHARAVRHVGVAN